MFIKKIIGKIVLFNSCSLLKKTKIQKSQYCISVSDKDIAKIPRDLNFRSHKEQLVNISRKSERKNSFSPRSVKETIMRNPFSVEHIYHERKDFKKRFDLL